MPRLCNGTIFASLMRTGLFRKRGANMGEIVRFVPKSDQERARLIREARAIYEQIFPPADQVSEPQVPKK
jgi:hypothetical protein